MYVYICVYLHIYIYTSREREREREIHDIIIMIKPVPHQVERETHAPTALAKLLAP